MTKNGWPRLKFTGGRLPSELQAAREQFIWRRSVVPHGDAEDCPHSRRIEYQVRVAGSPKNHIVRVLVLHNHVVRVDSRVMPQSPAHRLIQTLKDASFTEQVFR
jgi:hypothetical protein